MIAATYAMVGSSIEKTGAIGVRDSRACELAPSPDGLRRDPPGRQDQDAADEERK
jgi:hypothetical protein